MSEFASSKYTDDQAPLLKTLDTVELPAVAKFVAADSFTLANGIAWVSDNFRQFIFPLVEEGVAATTLIVSELTCLDKDHRISVELKVDEQGEVALAHYSHILKAPASQFREGGWIVAYVVGNDGDTWAVGACLRRRRWLVYASRRSHRSRRDAGSRFLSR